MSIQSLEKGKKIFSPTLFPLSRECMRPKLYMSTAESPSCPFFCFCVFSSHQKICIVASPTRLASPLHCLPESGTQNRSQTTALASQVRLSLLFAAHTDMPDKHYAHMCCCISHKCTHRAWSSHVSTFVLEVHTCL